MPSEVFSARLHPENSDEARALAILEELEADGYSRRKILTKALLALGAAHREDAEPDRQPYQPDAALILLREARELVAELRAVGRQSVQATPSHNSPQLDDSFINSVRSGARETIRLQD